MSDADKKRLRECLTQMLGEDPDVAFDKLVEDSPEGDVEWLPISI